MSRVKWNNPALSTTQNPTYELLVLVGGGAMVGV
jgi:hypothetical protein